MKYNVQTKTSVDDCSASGIMSILIERYDTPSLTSQSSLIDDDVKSIQQQYGSDVKNRNMNMNNETIKKNSNDWKKTRNYLYHASRSYQKIHDGDSTITLQQQVVTVLDFLDGRLDLPRRVTTKILQDSPRILRKPVDSFLIPTSDFLLQLWGRDLFLEAVDRNPAVLLSSGVGYTRRKSTTAEQNVDDILLKYTGLSSSVINGMKKTSPFVFGLAPAQIHSVLRYLKNILVQGDVDTITTTANNSTDNEKELKSMKILGKIVLGHANLLNLSVTNNLRPRIEFLVASCNLDPIEIAKVVETSNGSVLGLSVDNNLRPTIDFMLHNIFHDNSSTDNQHQRKQLLLKKCIITHPQLFGLSLANLKSKVGYFNSVIGPNFAVRIATKCPAIYSLNLDQNIIPTIEFLMKIWGIKTIAETSQRQLLQSMLNEYPNIITLSVETNIQPTMMFFNKTGYTILDDNWWLVSSDKEHDDNNESNSGIKATPSNRVRGRYIGASLYNRLLPRWHFCQNVDTSPKIPPLHVLVMSNNDKFCNAMGYRLESYMKFREEAIPRLKFSSQFDTWLKTGKPIDL